MKTTFKNAFTELDDEMMNIELTPNTDIDVDKIKGEVLMRIHNNSADTAPTKKKFGKKLFILLAAAVILAAGTVGVVAKGSIQSIFGQFFNTGSDLNSLGLFEGENVEISCEDKSLDIKLLGITGDCQRFYSCIEVTKKDGSEVIDKRFNYSPNWIENRSNATYKLNSDEDNTGVFSGWKYRISDDCKTLTIEIFSMGGKGLNGELQGGRMTFKSEAFSSYRIGKIITEGPDISNNQDDYDLSRSVDGTLQGLYYTEEQLDQMCRDAGVSPKKCMWQTLDGKYVYCESELKSFDMKFTISYDVNYDTGKLPEVEINSETAPNVVREFAENTKAVISPLGIYLKGECESTPKNEDLGCFQIPSFTDGKSKVILNDGTVYYIVPYEGGERRTDEDGIYHHTENLNYQTFSGMPLAAEKNVINLDNIKTVIINGDTIYSK